MEIARDIQRGSSGRVAPLSYLPERLEAKPLVPLAELHGSYYLRFAAEDRPGVLGRIAGDLGMHGVGIKSVLQKGRSDGGASVPLLILTHPCSEGALRQALESIDRRPDVTETTRVIRIEEEV